MIDYDKLAYMNKINYTKDYNNMLETAVGSSTAGIYQSHRMFIPSVLKLTSLNPIVTQS